MSFAVRNVVHSGVLARLHRGGARVDLILRRLPGEHDSLLSGAFEAASSARAMIAPSGRSERGRPLLNGIIGKAFSSRNDIGSYRLYRRWFGRELRGTGRLRSDIIECAGFLARPKPLYRWLYQRSEALYRRSRDLEPVRRQLCELRPDLVWSTVCSSPLEYPYVLAARDLKIPLVASILSFDNLTSRPALPLFDSYLVWNERMRDQLLSLYPEVSPESVSITGTTQFDFHRSEEFRWNRERTLRLLGLPPGARYFLYAASHESLAPEEPELVSALIRRLAEVSELRNHWLVVRLHPHDDGKRWAAITPAGARSRLAMAHERRPDPDGWAIPSAADQAQLVSSIAHCDACINIVSTMTLDAAVLDRPVVGIEFSREPASPQGIMFSEYEADHYKPVVESGGLRLARRWPELMGYLREAIENPERDREKRARLVRNECGVVDGHAADRITAALQGLLKSRGRFLQTDEKLSQIADREFSIA
jgi:CDP-glycerol glycerophosphotransferase (TagB/SpsB family)